MADAALSSAEAIMADAKASTVKVVGLRLVYTKAAVQVSRGRRCSQTLQQCWHPSNFIAEWVGIRRVLHLERCLRT